MDLIINTILAFNGEIMGGYVRDTHANINRFKDLDCRVDRDVVNILLNVLSINFDVKFHLPTQNHVIWDILTYTLTSRADSTKTYMIDILTCHITKWAGYPCDFDVNLLAQNNNNLFVRPNMSTSLILLNNRLNFILGRCKNHTFALVDIPRFSFGDIIKNITRAFDLVGRGWIMDDFYKGNASYLINKWKFIHEGHPKFGELRTKYTAELLDIMKSQNECSICHEIFSKDDLVFNSCCNHNFHFKCSPIMSDVAKQGGIFYWFLQKQAFSCPCCRQDAIHFSFV